MALDLYTSTGLQAPAQNVRQQAFQQGRQKTGFLGRAAAPAKRRLAQNEANIKDAIDAWGIDVVMEWDKNSGRMMQGVMDDLRQARQTAMKARAEGDMQRYQMALQRSLFDKQMAARADQLNKAKVGQIFTGIMGGLFELAGGLIESGQARRRREEEFSRYKEWWGEMPNMVNWRPYMNQPPVG